MIRSMIKHFLYAVRYHFEPANQNHRASGEPAWRDFKSSIFSDRYGKKFNFHDNPGIEENRIGIFAAIMADKHILLVSSPWAPDIAELPGGGTDPHETVEEALQREIEEETGIVLPADISAFSAARNYMNSYAESTNTYIRYNQIFYFFNADAHITPHQERVEAEDGSISFWHPVDRLHELQIRAGHEDMVDKAAKLYWPIFHDIKQQLEQ